MNDKWNEHVERAKRIFPQGAKTVKGDKHHRRHHLGNIIEWLKLTETPLQAAQQAVAEGLKAYWDANNPASLFTLTDVAQTVNMAVSLVGHARDIVSTLIAELEDLPEPKPLPEMRVWGEYTCSDCLIDFAEPKIWKGNQVCPDCNSENFDVTIPF